MFVSQAPDLTHDTTKAPHITGSGVLSIVQSLNTIDNVKVIIHNTEEVSACYFTFPSHLLCCPFDLCLSSMRDVVYVSSSRSRDIPQSLQSAQTMICQSKLITS